MSTISVVMLVKDEENNIRDCLESIKWVDEVIIIDNGSRDKTVELCKLYTDKIFLQPGDYCLKMINRGIDNSSSEWVLNIDADETVSSQLAKEIRKVIDSNPEENAFYVPFIHHFMGKALKHGGWHPSYIKRLYRKGKAGYASDCYHSQVEVDGKVGYLKNHIVHKNPGSIWLWLSKTNFYSERDCQVKLKTQRYILYRITLRPILFFIHKYIFLQGFRDGLPGFLNAVFTTFNYFVTDAKIAEHRFLHRSKRA